MYGRKLKIGFLLWVLLFLVSLRSFPDDESMSSNEEPLSLSEELMLISIELDQISTELNSVFKTLSKESAMQGETLQRLEEVLPALKEKLTALENRLTEVENSLSGGLISVEESKNLVNELERRVKEHRSLRKRIDLLQKIGGISGGILILVAVIFALIAIF